MVRPTDTLLHRDSAGDALYAAAPRGPHGTLIFIRPGEGEMYLPTRAVDALRDALAGADGIEVCADCGHLPAAHDGEGCDASGARVVTCTCMFFIPGSTVPSANS